MSGAATEPPAEGIAKELEEERNRRKIAEERIQKLEAEAQILMQLLKNTDSIISSQTSISNMLSETQFSEKEGLYYQGRRVRDYIQYVGDDFRREFDYMGQQLHENNSILRKFIVDIFPQESGSGLTQIQLLKKKMAVIFSQLSTREAIQLFPLHAISALSAAIIAYFGKYIVVISPAFAEEHNFTPPLGLSQSVFTYVVLVFVGLFVLLVFGLFYAGFLAKPKNQGAANAVSRLVTFLSGALIGLKAP